VTFNKTRQIRIALYYVVSGVTTLEIGSSKKRIKNASDTHIN